MTLVNNLTTNFSPDMTLRSIIKASPISPGAKLQAATALIRGQRIKDLAADLGVSAMHLSRASGSTEYRQLKERAADLLGLQPEDIWPASEAA